MKKPTELTLSSSSSFNSEFEALSPNFQAWLSARDEEVRHARMVKASRAAATAKRNSKRGEDTRVPIQKALENISLHDKTMKELVRIVVNYLTTKRLPCPCSKTIEREISKQRRDIMNQS